MSAGDRRVRRGSSTSDKQVAYAVRNGHEIEFHHGVDGIHVVRGYVFGMDDYHWAVVTESLHQWLVHKSAPLLHISPDPTLPDENKQAEIESLVAPFREWVMRTHFRQTATKE